MRAAEDMDTHRRFQGRPPDRKQRTQPRLLDEPRPMGVELQHDVAGQGRVSSSLVRRQRIHVQRRQAVPVATGRKQHRVV